MLESTVALLFLVFSVNRQKSFYKNTVYICKKLFKIVKKIVNFYSFITCLLTSVYHLSINYILMSNVFYLFGVN